MGSRGRDSYDYDVTCSKVITGKLSLKVYSKGKTYLRHRSDGTDNTMVVSANRKCWMGFPGRACLKNVLERFVEVLCCMDRCFHRRRPTGTVATHSVVGASRVGGVD